MPADENTRLRIRQYLIELMDEDAADAMMESMPPIPWTQLATKDDIARLDGRFDTLTVRVDQTSSDVRELTRTVAEQGTSVNARIDGLTQQSTTLATRMDSLTEQGTTLSTRVDGLTQQGTTLATRMDSLGMRMDALSAQMGELGRAVSFAAATMAVMLAVFIVGTIASLIASGAIG
jgi:outer membrane murein-binding lipoprotein Lpp